MKNTLRLASYPAKVWDGKGPVPLDVTFEVDEIGVPTKNAFVLDQTGSFQIPYESYCPHCNVLHLEEVPNVAPRHKCPSCSRPLVQPWYLPVFKEYLDTSFDGALTRCNALVWLTWVGKHYKECKRRILVFGESHYANQVDPKQRQLEIADWFADDWSTREIIGWYPLLGPAQAGSSNNGGRSSIPTFDNLFKIVAEDSLVDNTLECREKRAKLCNHLAFANFFQRPFIYIPTFRERPSCTYAHDDHLPAWEAALHEISVLKPTLCLFLGVTAATCFDYYMTHFRNQFNITSWNLMVHKSRINGCCPRSATITLGGSTVALEFIKHPGMFVTCSAWREYLLKRVPWLKNEIDAIFA